MLYQKLFPDYRKKIVPLLELPRDDSYTESKLVKKIDKSVKKMKSSIELSFTFYIDNYEVPDELTIHDTDNYLYLIEAFKDFDIIPIVGFDRTETHNLIGINYANNDSEKVALRITHDYFDSFMAYEKDLESILNNLESNVSCTLLLDCNYIDDSNIDNMRNKLLRIMENLIGIERFKKIVITGSSIPASIATKVKTNTNVHIIRNEVTLFKRINSIYPRELLVFSDYTVISPGYSEINVEPELIQNVMTPRIIYSLIDSHYISRGRAIKQYKLDQYFKQAEDLINESFFRGKEYSWGDNYLFEKATYKGTNITPSTIIGPVVNAHITLMINEILKGSI